MKFFDLPPCHGYVPKGVAMEGDRVTRGADQMTDEFFTISEQKHVWFFCRGCGLRVESGRATANVASAIDSVGIRRRQHGRRKEKRPFWMT